MTSRIHCQVLEVSGIENWRPRQSRPRDLLPWADPYIARLIQRLESRYNADSDEEDLSDLFAADDSPWLPPEFDDWDGMEDWEDAFMPPPLEVPCYCDQLPVYGGFPLLDDISKDDDADSI